MEIITIGFSRPKKWQPFAWLIMKGYNIPYDHVYVKFHSDSYDRDLIYQASSTMINFMSPAIFLDRNIVVKEFDFAVTQNKKTEIIQYCIDNAGVPYGKKQALGLAWVRINDLCGNKIKNPFRDGRMSEVCCEAAAIILRDLMDIKIDIDLDTINPKELYELLCKITGETIA